MFVRGMHTTFVCWKTKKSHTRGIYSITREGGGHRVFGWERARVGGGGGSCITDRIEFLSDGFILNWK